VRRVIHDVPRWSVFLHRQARGLGLVEHDDPPGRRLEDELFERLYAGELALLPGNQVDAIFAPWAQRVHAACAQLPAFERLARECRSDPDAAATAVETLLADLANEMADVDLRRAARSGCTRAVAAVGELRDAAEGLEHVAFGTAMGQNSGVGRSACRALAARLKTDARLRRIAQLAGKFSRIVASKRRARVRHGADEIGDVEQGSDLARLLPAELALLVHPRARLATLRDLHEQRCLQYALRSNEMLGKGPLVVAVDKSGSMEGLPDVWATAVALALLDVAAAERRAFALICFDGAIRHESVIMPGELLPEAGLFVSCDGGTNIHAAIGRGLEIIAQHSGALKEADLVLITDGASDISGAEDLRARAESLGVSVFGFGIGIDPTGLDPWCDEAHAVVNLDRIEEHAVEALFVE